MPNLPLRGANVRQGAPPQISDPPSNIRLPQIIWPVEDQRPAPPLFVIDAVAKTV